MNLVSCFHAFPPAASSCSTFSFANVCFFQKPDLNAPQERRTFCKLIAFCMQACSVWNILRGRRSWGLPGRGGDYHRARQSDGRLWLTETENIPSGPSWCLLSHRAWSPSSESPDCARLRLGLVSRDGQEQLALGELMVSMGWVKWRHRAPGEFSFREANATGEVVWNCGVASLPAPQEKAGQGMNSHCALLWATPSRHTHANSGCGHSMLRISSRWGLWSIGSPRGKEGGPPKEEEPRGPLTSQGCRLASCGFCILCAFVILS